MMGHLFLLASRFAIEDDETTNWVTIWIAISLAAAIGLLLMMAFMKESIRKVLQRKRD
jgi:hypothetical protein